MDSRGAKQILVINMDVLIGTISNCVVQYRYLYISRFWCYMVNHIIGSDYPMYCGSFRLRKTPNSCTKNHRQSKLDIQRFWCKLDTIGRYRYDHSMYRCSHFSHRPIHDHSKHQWLYLYIGNTVQYTIRE